MSDEQQSSSMDDADTANGEGDPHGGGEQAEQVDPDAPGASLVGNQEGDDVEPNEPG